MRPDPRPWLAVLALLGAPAAATRQAEAADPAGAPDVDVVGEDPWAGLPPDLDVPYLPTPPEVVAAMLRLAGTGPGDVVYDLGCGDGRIVITAVRDFGARLGVCVELDPLRLADAEGNARAAGVEQRIVLVEADLFQVDLGEATVVALYLLPDVNEALRPKLLRELRPGSRVVSHAFGMGDWKPEKELRVGGRPVYLWSVPEGAGGGPESPPTQPRESLDPASAGPTGVAR